MGTRLRDLFNDQPIETQSGPVSITVSLGVAHDNPAAATLEELLDRADAALYEAKQNGRNRVEMI